MEKRDLCRNWSYAINNFAIKNKKSVSVYKRERERKIDRDGENEIVRERW